MGKRLDLRGSLEIVRRQLAVLWVAAALGLLAGAGYVALSPTIHRSTALVVLPSTTSNSPTEVVVASSYPVLQRSLTRLHRAQSVQSLRSDIQVTNLTTDVISITARGGSDGQAEETANAVATSYVAYIGSASSPVGPVPARVLVAATDATAPRPLARMLATGLLGFLLGTAIGVSCALALGRKDRRLRRRDDIADAIGVPVLASVCLGKPGAAGWTALLESYEPTPADAWRLSSVLNDLKLTDQAPGDHYAGCSVTVVSLAGDQGALALGPQLAAFAAALGVPTVLVVGPHQDTEAGVALHAAARARPARLRSGRLRLAVRDTRRRSAGRQDGVLTVVAAVVNARDRQVVLPRTEMTLLAVSAGAVTATQLARVAASTTADGGRLAGILVGDPDPDDATTGFLPQLARPNHRKMPSRLTAGLR
jgi:capsular polysaccharide biosynthesis protein